MCGGWSRVEVDGAGWRWVHGLAMPEYWYINTWSWGCCEKAEIVSIKELLLDMVKKNEDGNELFAKEMWLVSNDLILFWNVSCELYAITVVDWQYSYERYLSFEQALTWSKEHTLISNTFIVDSEKW